MGDRRAPIPRAKLRGLREALERDGEVVFNTGRTARLVHREYRKPSDEAPQVYAFVEVEGTGGGVTRHDFSDEGELERAYKMALFGPAPKPQPESKRDFGDDPPF